MKTLISIPERTPRATPIEKALYALTRAQANPPTRGDRSDFAKSIFADDRTVRAIIERAAAPVGTTAGSGFAAELVQNLVGDFLASLAPLSAAATLISQGLQVPLNANGMKLPAREGAPSTTVDWVGESNPIPVRRYNLNDDCELSPRKFGFIIGVSRELAKRAGGEAVIRQLIREDASASLDGALFSTEAGDTERHAGMLAGVSALTGYAGGDRMAIETDLGALTDVVTAAGSGQVAFIVSPKRAARMRILAPDLNRELTFLPSLAVAETTVVAIDPRSWAYGFGDDLDLDVSNSAVLHMSDDPDPIVDGGTAAPVRGLWQTDAIALRLITDVAFAPRRPNAVAWLEGATW